MTGLGRIDVLPDDVLLEIFDFYIKMYSSSAFGDKTEAETWQSLVHVCRRWRSLVLRSPHGLNLQLYCTPKTPAKETLDVWPALPLIVRGDMTLSGTDNVIAALGHSNRVCQVFLGGLVDWQLEQVLVAMQVSFPELTDLRFISDGRTLLFIPDSFLDGSAPRLRHFSLSGVPFPGLPRLLLSATHLVSLWLENTPHSGYISPEAIVTLLSVLSGLEDLSLEFRSPQSCPDLEIRRPLSSERYVVPALHYFHFKGVIEYLEDLVTGIDTPQLDRMEIIFFNQINFDTLRLARFIHRTPKLTKRDALVQFNDRFASVRLPPGLSTLEITILCREPDWQLSSVEQVCNSSLHPLSTVEDLYIEHQYSQLVWKNDAIDNTQWLQLLLPFTAVKNLYLSKEFAPGIAAALQELVSGRILEVLPSLKNIFVKKLEPSGPFQKNIRRFVTARQLSDHPITTSKTDDAVCKLQPAHSAFTLILCHSSRATGRRLA